MTRTENPLAQFAFDASFESKRLNTLSPEKKLRELTQNLRGYENEVVKDLPVSIKYSYWFDARGDLYNHPDSTDPKDLAVRGISPQERDGATLGGFKKVTRALYENPGSVVLWYSPAGPASFGKDPSNPYSEISFDYGQLYIQHLVGNEVSATAIKVTDEAILEHFMPHVTGAVETLETEKERMQYFLSHPHITGLSLVEFLAQELPDDFTHTNHRGESFHLREVMDLVRQSLMSRGVPIEDSELVEIAQSLSHADVTEDQLSKIYYSRIAKEMTAKGLTTMSLAGSCGGRSVTSSEIQNLLGLNDIFSSQFRLLSQTESPTRYPDYECPGCHQMLSGELKKDQSSWRKECEHCGHRLNC